VTEFDAVYYDGKTSARNVVRVRAADGSLHIAGEAVNLNVPLASASVDSPVPGVRRAIHLPGGGQLQTNDHGALEALFPSANRFERWVYGLEGHWRHALTGLVIVAVLSAWCVIYGLPLAAKLATGFVPPELEAKLGEQALASIDATLCSPSRLDVQRQQSLRAAFDILTAGLDDGHRYRLELRACGGMGPNAFALPGGAIVLTDDLVRLAQNDAQVSAVLAHEIGHVRHRHGLRQALQAAGLAALISALAGDAVSITSLAATLPMILLQSGYSREFEDEADSYAFQRLKEIGLSPRVFAEIMTRLDEFRTDGGGAKKSASGEHPLDYLSTHPATAQRIERALANQ
jgi:predicted Zn-dependent protease